MQKEYEILIEKIKKEREFLQIYQYEVALELNIDERTYRNIEKGKSKLSMFQFLIICNKLNRNPSYFFDGMNTTVFKNCSNSGNNNVYTINEANKESLKMLIDIFQKKLNEL